MKISFRNFSPSLKKFLPVLIIICFASCTTTPSKFQSPPPSQNNDPIETPKSFANGTIQVWFTDPSHSRQEFAPRDAILEAIDSATDKIDLAMYSFSDPAIENALLRAERRGVKVQMVMETDNLSKSIPKRIRSAGIPIVGDGQDSLMHDKFMIVDGKTLLVGSVNFTDSGLNADNNYLVEIHDPSLAAAYTEEFQSMFKGNDFGAADLTPSPRHDFHTGGDGVEVYFAPEDHVANEIHNLLEHAQESIHFLAYTFTLDNLGQTVVHQYQSGLDVRGVFDADMLPGSAGSEFDLLRRAGLDVHLDGNPGLMHEKLIIIDGKIVVIGSFNYTRAADERNDENIMVIHDAALAQVFETEFQKVLSTSQP